MRPLSAARTVNVLLIEADPAVADATAMLLRTQGHAVVCVSGIDAALDLVADEGVSPDAIVCDAHLRGADSVLDAIRRLRRRADRAIPVLVTSDAPSRLERSAASLEACRVMPKPAFSGELIEFLRELLPG
jgi:CheY-like chemotaxis protein